MTHTGACVQHVGVPWGPCEVPRVSAQAPGASRCATRGMTVTSDELFRAMAAVITGAFETVRRALRWFWDG